MGNPVNQLRFPQRRNPMQQAVQMLTLRNLVQQRRQGQVEGPLRQRRLELENAALERQAAAAPGKEQRDITEFNLRVQQAIQGMTDNEITQSRKDIDRFASMLKGHLNLPTFEQRAAAFPGLIAQAAKEGAGPAEELATLKSLGGTDYTPEFEKMLVESGTRFKAFRDEVAAEEDRRRTKEEATQAKDGFSSTYKNWLETEGLPKNAKQEMQFRREVWPGLKGSNPTMALLAERAAQGDEVAIKAMEFLKPEGLTPAQQATEKYRTSQVESRARERARDEIDDLLNDAAGFGGGTPEPEEVKRLALARGIADLEALYEAAGRKMPTEYAEGAASTGEEETMPDGSVWRKTPAGRVRVR